MRTSSPVRVLLLPVKEQVSRCGSASKLRLFNTVKRNCNFVQINMNVKRKSHHIRYNLIRKAAKRGRFIITQRFKRRRRNEPGRVDAGEVGKTLVTLFN